MLSAAVQAIYRLPYFPGQWRLAGALSRLLPRSVGVFRDGNGIRYFAHVRSHIGHCLAVGQTLEDEIEALVPSGPLGLVVDAGCNAGTFSLPLAHRAKQIVCIDADEELIGLLRQTIALNGFQNVEAICAAVASTGDVVKFNVAANLKDLSSRDPNMLAGRDAFTTKTVPALRLAKIIDRLGPVDLLKIDIEGFSGDAILSLGDKLPSVRRIIAEDSPDMGAAVSRLRDAGFKVSQPLLDRPLADHVRTTWLAEL